MRKRSKILLLVVAGFAGAIALMFMSSLAAFIYLVIIEPSLSDVQVYEFNDTYEKVSWRTDGDETYLSKYVTTGRVLGTR